MNKYVPYLIGSLVGIMLALIIAVIGFFVVRDKYELVEVKEINYVEDNVIVEDNEISQDSTETTLVEKNFDGDYLLGWTPTGWSIIEYRDGEGSDMLVSNVTYTGLTAIEILNDDQLIFKLNAVNGVGGTDQCYKYVKFEDFKQSDYDEINAYNISTHGASVELVDLRNTDYSQFKLLNLDVRRIGKDLYWDRVSGNEYFESATCAMQSGFPKIEGIRFYNDGQESTQYSWKIEGNPSSEELQILDDILNSLELK